MKHRIFMAVVLLAAFFVAGCGLSAANDNNGLPTEEQLAAAKGELGNDMSELKFSVDGMIFQYPMIMQDMLDAGWYVDNSVKNELKTLEANTRTTNFVLRKNRDGEYGITECSVVASNSGVSEVEIGETKLYNLNFRREKGAVLILPQGLNWDSTFEEVCEAYQPSQEQIADMEGVLSIQFSNASGDGNLTMWFNAETRKLSELKFFQAL